MEKIIEIDGKFIPFKGDRQIYSQYQKLLKRNLFSDLGEVYNIVALKISPRTSPIKDLNKIDFEALTRIVWFFAWNADPTIPKPKKWIDQFEKFPIVDILANLSDLMIYSSTKERGSIHGR
ncbi:hypothetical protein [Fictibacillus norfolkensis]|uniref:DUF1232 domain-containing protein n=1 Tax=Fictibacillus norfolkensis TaxID=2762233 RepID=A0ABR8SSB7_9BACL|nr:hypothetical protein [Fictibacillus norfolkensis]MBD7966259.1 hypothetical protein [Fictibacillus norfolkensis]